MVALQPLAWVTKKRERNIPYSSRNEPDVLFMHCVHECIAHLISSDVIALQNNSIQCALVQPSAVLVCYPYGHMVQWLVQVLGGTGMECDLTAL